MTEIKYFKPDPLPTFTPPDIAGSFLKSYNASREAETTNQYKQGQLALQGQQLDLEKAKLADFQQSAPQRQEMDKIKATMAQLSQDNAFMDLQNRRLAMLDPNSKTFDQDVANMAADTERDLVERFKVDPDTAHQIISRSKAITPDMVQRLRVQQGLQKEDEKPKQQIVNGQLVTLKDGQATASDIPGLKKEQEQYAPTQLSRMISERNSFPEGSEERKIYDNALAAKTISQTAEGYNSFTPEQKKFFLDQALQTGERPYFGSGFKAANDYKAFSKDLAEYATSQGVTGRDIVANKAEIAADIGSSKAQTKNLDYMKSFAKNIDSQIDRVGELYDDVSRFDTRILNVPLVKAKTMLTGSPEESKLAVYMQEIQSETARLSSGNAQSIAELSQGARERWQKLIDGNLSIKDAKDLLGEIKKTAEIRVNSASQQLKDTKGRIKGADSNQKDNTNPEIATEQKQLDVATAKSYLQKAGGDKKKARELAKQDGYTF